MKKIPYKKIIILLIFALIIFLGVVYIHNGNSESTTEMISFNKLEKKSFKSDEKFTKINFMLTNKDKSDIKLIVHNPNGEILDTTDLKNGIEYDKKFENIKGEWILELTSKENKDMDVLCTITRSNK